MLVNAGFCFTLAFWPLPAIVLSTTSVLVAARNFQSAWLMRSLGEETYRDWHVARIQETRITLYLFCLGGNTLLTAGVGAAVIYFSNMAVVPFGIGAGIIAYAGAVAFYTLLAIVRMRRNGIRREEREARNFAASQAFYTPGSDNFPANSALKPGSAGVSAEAELKNGDLSKTFLEPRPEPQGK